MPAVSTTYRERLQRSFGALYAALEVPHIARWVVFVLLIIHTGLLAYNAYVHSPTLNEPGHLVAGLSNWEFGRFELYRVNPPLVRMIAALPVIAAGYQEDWRGFSEDPGARPEMPMGGNFVAANGARSRVLFTIARWVCIPFSWLGAIACYLWARDLYGYPSGVLACTIWCFEPNVLAHSSLITPDAHATALGLAACYTFWRWLKKPTWAQAALTGVVLGLAELAKTTLILFYPLWPLMWIIYRWSEQRESRKVAISLREMKNESDALAERETYTLMRPRDWLREAGMLAMRMLIGLYVLNLGYAFEGSLTTLKDFHFVSNLFTGSDSPNVAVSLRETNPHAEREDYSVNRFADSWVGMLPVPFPKNYLLGIDIQQRDFEHYGRPSYLRGEWRDHGWWYYYLYAVAIKVPLGLWLLCLLALFLSLRSKTRRGEERPGEGALSLRRSEERPVEGALTPLPLGEGSPKADSRKPTASFQPTASARDQFILLFPAIVIFVVVSSKTGFSEHMRYVLPAFPFFFIWVTGVTRKCLTAAHGGCYPAPKSRWRIVRVSLFSANLIAICWLILSSLSVYPHSLSYFNESIGGPLNGPKHLLGSNVDWGQDSYYILAELANDASSDTLYISANALYDGRDLGIACEVWDGTISSSLRSDLSVKTDVDWPLGQYVISSNKVCELVGDGSCVLAQSLIEEFETVGICADKRFTYGLFLFELSARP